MSSAPFHGPVALACAAGCVTLIAGNTDGAQPTSGMPLSLRRIMQDLGRDMAAATGTICHEDWAAVEKLASRIASHPQPPVGEKLRIQAYAGRNASAFRAHDERTHDAAIALQKAAVAGEGKSVIAAFGTLQNICLACHQAFRSSFVEHFYGTH